MIGLSFKPVGKRPTAAQIEKNLRFGTANGINRTLDQGQGAVRGALKGTFTLRGSWFEERNKFGIRKRKAHHTRLFGEINTAADWLEPHETGKTKTGRAGGRIAVPTENVRRNKRDIITKANRPARLRGKKTFVIKTSKGDVLFQRRKTGLRYQGPTLKGGATRRMKKTGSELVALYNLEPRVRIRKQSTFYMPIEKVVNRRLRQNIANGIEHALRTMK